MTAPKVLPVVRLVITEKPSVARDIARVLGARTRHDGYLEGAGVRVAWCLGHLLELQEPHEYEAEWKRWRLADLPMLPDPLRFRPIKRTSKQLSVLKRLLRASDVDLVVNGCDAGREGELIFRLVYDHAFGGGRGKAVKRLWISSLTDQAIHRGFASLEPGAAFDRLGDAARCRSEADWLVGLNATRALTLVTRKGGADGVLMSLGRVQTPTLAMIVRREDEIDAFVPEPFWQVLARFQPRRPDLATYEGTWRRGDSDRMKTEAEARAVADAVRARPGQAAKVERKSVRERPPFLFDLTALQKRANQRFAMSADRTLKAAQALYEQHKAITYPRTDSRFLTADMAPKLPAVVRRLEQSPWSAAAQAVAAANLRPGPRVIHDAEVGDHHAIIPTGRLPDLERLGQDERRVFELVARRLLAALLPDAVFASTRIETRVGDHAFLSIGRVRLEEGWQLAEPPPPPKPGQRPTPDLPAIDRGDAVDVAAVRVLEGKTQPPKRFDEATLLGAMERPDRHLDDESEGPAPEAEVRRAMKASGLGTPATRASIIETLLRREFIRRERKSLVPTTRGRALVGAVPTPELLSAALTGEWEARLARMAEGGADRASFMADIRAFTRTAIQAIAVMEPPSVPSPAREPLGKCPVCSTTVTEGRRAYSCERGKDCTFVIFKSIAGRATSPALVRLLLAKGHSRELKGFKSKTSGKSFSAALRLRADGTVEMDFERKGGGAARPARASGPPKPPKPRAPDGPLCPRCRTGRVIKGRQAWGCHRWREGCEFRVQFQQRGLRLPDDEADRLLRRKQTRLMEGLVREGKARLVLDLRAPGNVRVERAKRRGG